MSMTFYNSRAWRRTAKAFLAENPLCVACQAQGRVTPAQQVDHIIPLHQNPAPLDPAGLQALCLRHHALKTWNTEGKGISYHEPGCDASGMPNDAHHAWRQQV